MNDKTHAQDECVCWLGRQNQSDADEEQASIFVNHIPEGIEAPRLLQAFSVFGNVRNGLKGIKVKPQRGKDTYAFIDFETAAAVEKSVASPPVIDGKQVLAWASPLYSRFVWFVPAHHAFFFGWH